MQSALVERATPLYVCGMRWGVKVGFLGGVMAGVMAVSVGASGCHGLRARDASRALNGQEFSLQFVEGNDLLAGAEMTLGFAAQEFFFVADCNRHFGTYVVDAGRLFVTSIGSTEKGCEEAQQTQDAWLSGFFLSKPELKLDGPTLTLSDGEAVLVFVERKSLDKPENAQK